MDLKERNDNPNRHPWELSRADMVLDLLRANPSTTRYADIGSGDLYFAKLLSRQTAGLVYAVDVNYGAPVSDGAVRVCTSLDQVPDAAVECALLMDVLEHVEDDVDLLEKTKRVTTPSGTILITVPAHAFLWSQHDVFLGHYRRYSRTTLLAALERARLDVTECFYFYALPFAARALGVTLSRVGWRGPQAAAVAAWPYAERHPVTRIIRGMLNSDFRVSRWMGGMALARCGLSICARCRPRSA